jgi:hypothetical protein
MFVALKVYYVEVLSELLIEMWFNGHVNVIEGRNAFRSFMIKSVKTMVVLMPCRRHVR